MSNSLFPHLVKFLPNIWILKNSFKLVGKENFTLLGTYMCCSYFLLQKYCHCHCNAWADLKEVAVGMEALGWSS